MSLSFEKFAKTPVIDCHTHFLDPKKVEDTLKVIYKVGFHKIVLLSLIDENKVNYNPEVLLLKAQHPELFFCLRKLRLLFSF